MKLHRTPRIAAPPLVPFEWANGSPGGLESALGRVVLLHFFPWSDPETVRELPSIDGVAEHYRAAGLETFGVHVPIEEFERSIEAVRDEIWRLGIGYPVALDWSGDIVRAYENRTLPAQYLVDRAGFVRGWRHGPGGADEIEAALRVLLAEAPPAEAPPPLVPPSSPPAPLPPPLSTPLPPVAWAPSAPLRFALPPGGEGSSAEGVRTFPELPEIRAQGAPYFEGAWDVRRDRVVAAAPGARLAVVFEGAGVRAVLSPPKDAAEPPVISVVLDGETLSPVTIDRGRVYDLAASEFGVHHLDLLAAPGLAVHRITFDPADAPVV